MAARAATYKMALFKFEISKHMAGSTTLGPGGCHEVMTIKLRLNHSGPMAKSTYQNL